MRPALTLTVLACLCACLPAADRDKQRAPRPPRFAVVFSNGYGGDHLPKDDAGFEKLLLAVKAGGFDVVQTTYTPSRVKLCEKHDVKLMVDLLADEHHVYKSADKAKAVCEALRDNKAVWGYNLWNDPINKTSEGRKRDADNVRQWDPTHPSFVGTYRTAGMRGVTNADVIGYYDFHWKRGRGQHFGHLAAYLAWAKERDARWMSWLATDSGIPGKGNLNRSMWSAHTSVAFGSKGVMWFLGTRIFDMKATEWTAAGKDIVAVNKTLAPLVGEIARLGNPTAVYSTPITRDANNDPVAKDGKPVMPVGLEKHAFPATTSLVPKSGEFLAGMFADGTGEAAYVVNHNAYEAQTVTFAWKGAEALEVFDRAKGAYVPLKATDGVYTLALAAGGGELVRRRGS